MIGYPVEAFGKPLAQALRDTPVPQGTEVLLKVGHCGVCHSDLHLHDGFYDLGDGRTLDVRKRVGLPRVLGHEIAGTVAAIGVHRDGGFADHVRRARRLNPRPCCSWPRWTPASGRWRAWPGPRR